MDFKRLSDQDLEALRDEITEYFETYYSELRSRMSDHGSPIYGRAPEFLKGYRRVVTVLGKDGVVITHWPAERDSFDFHLSPDRQARDIAAEECAGEQILDYQPGSDFGTYEITEPLKLMVGDQVVWTSRWKRMDISSRLDAWRNTEQARQAAEEDLASYTGTS